MIFPRHAARVALALAVALSSIPHVHSQTDNRASLGINLWFHTDFNNSFAFTDLVKRSRPWGSADRPFEPITNVDPLGWPRQDAGVFLHVSRMENARGREAEGPAPLPAGIYRIVFNGQASLIQPTEGEIRNLTFDRASNTTRAEWILVTPASNNVMMSFRGTRREPGARTSTGLTNLRIFLPGFPDDGSVLFTPDFKRVIQRFGIIRFMDWVDANVNPVRHFSQRTRPEAATQWPLAPASGFEGLEFFGPSFGVAFEHMVQLCNETKTDMWLNIPALATDSFIRQTLRLIRDGDRARGYPGLNRARKLYVEYGNEIWNSRSANRFFCYERVKKLSDAARADRAHPVNFDGTPSEFEALFRFVAFRLKTISDICREEFGDEAMITRVRPVLAAQFGDGSASFSTGLRFLHTFCGAVRPNNPVARPVHEVVFGGGGAAYALGGTGSRDTFFASLPHREFAPAARTDAILAKAYGLRCIAYEGGPSIADPESGNAALPPFLARQFNADPRMEDAVVRMHDAWTAAGGDILVYYVATGDPAFEFTPADRQQRTPKLRAINKIRRRPPAAITTGRSILGTYRIASSPSLINEGNFIPKSRNRVFLRADTFLLGPGQILLPVRNSGSAAQRVVVSVETSGDERDASFDVFLNGTQVGRRVRVAADSPATFRRVGAAVAQPGLNVFRFTAVSRQSQLLRLRVRPL